MTVPASVPSLIQGSSPAASVLAVKNSFPPRAVKSPRDESLVPARMSFSRCVPASVPSVTYSSFPVAGS